ncbi:endolysin [Arthrobacter phage Galaxy]|uniref:Endolysin n=1 Tax=Arthrobacter phage Galaxy TaxID=1772326 RepID=A0A0U4IDK0_9CAUD|nr:endolysin [Arthrobacter phage Galaxy]ALY08870.1 endolysin [Arthrobacter phage Galaxy]
MLLSNLATVLRAAGLTVVETPGWNGRGYKGRDLIEIRGVLWHHTATNRARFNGADAPTLQMCIDGRTDVAGPLCNIVFGRNGTVYLVASGLANHAGAGEAANIPRDLGNYYLIGIEMESSGVAPFDWTPDQLRVAPHLGAALERAYLGHLPAELRLQIGHLEYSSQGKIDPAGWPGGMDGLRASINELLAGGAPAPAPSPAPAPAPAPAAPAGDNRIHWVVERGDTLGGIAAHYGGPSAAQIAAYNGIPDANRIEVGQRIYIPGPLVWIVDPGDTLGAIGAHYGISAETVAANNGLNVNAPIFPGQRLRIID